MVWKQYTFTENYAPQIDLFLGWHCLTQCSLVILGRWTMVHSDPCAREGSYRTWQFPILLNCEGPEIICMG